MKSEEKSKIQQTASRVGGRLRSYFVGERVSEARLLSAIFSAVGKTKMPNGEDCRFSPRALLLYEMAKRRAKRTAEPCQNNKEPSGREA